MGLYVIVGVRDATRDVYLGDEGCTETRYDSPGELYRALAGRGAYSWERLGRCIGKVYTHPPDAPARHIGWVFVKRDSYDDDPSKSYLRESWVTVHTAPDTITRTPHYAPLGRNA